MTRRDECPEVLVVGAGPAGLATAIGAAQAGLEVTVLDRRGRPPLDKPCGEGLMPPAVDRLAELGVDLARAGARPFRGIRWLDGERVVAAMLPRPGLGVRRLCLHTALVERSAALGVVPCWETPVQTLRSAKRGFEAEIPGGRLRPRFVVVADGLRSPLRRQAGLEAGSRSGPRFGVRRHYRVRPWSDHVEVYWGPRGEAYVTPVGAEEVGVAMLWSGAKLGFDPLLAQFPELERRLGGAPATTRDLGTGPLRQRVRDVVRGNLALVGDAGGYLDAITGEGLAIAFAQAAALSRAMAGGDLRSYRAAHRDAARLPELLTRLALLLSSSPALRRRVFDRFAEDPDLFRRLLGIASGTAPLRSVGLSSALRLARCVAGL